jgi:hypothetical protein
LYVHRQSDVYRQQKFQDVDLNLLQLDTLNNLPIGMMSDESKRKHANHVEQAILTGHVIDNTDTLSIIESLDKEKFARNKENLHELYDNVSAASKDTNQPTTPMLIYGNYHQQRLGIRNSLTDSSTSPSIVKQRRSTTAQPSQTRLLSDEKEEFSDKTSIVFVDEDPSESPAKHQSNQLTDRKNPNSHLSQTDIQSCPLATEIDTYL